jgi:hypothetical protein
MSLNSVLDVESRELNDVVDSDIEDEVDKDIVVKVPHTHVCVCVCGYTNVCVIDVYFRVLSSSVCHRFLVFLVNSSLYLELAG